MGLLGLSPRVRGNLAWRDQALVDQGSIPACAGNHERHYASADRVGSIPACAGEPSRRSPARRDGSVYPRVCGGTGFLVDVRRNVGGLSPRVRGNLQDPRRRRELEEVYPRVCGGTFSTPRPDAFDRGLSPRVRGNLGRRERSAGLDRSIPACAGEPASRWGTTLSRWVYPRVCGGTPASTVTLSAPAGLSPRVRGNHGVRDHQTKVVGSIPACAGELLVGRERWRHPGSIPACAGEPLGFQGVLVADARVIGPARCVGSGWLWAARTLGESPSVWREPGSPCPSLWLSKVCSPCAWGAPGFCTVFRLSCWSAKG